MPIYSSQENPYLGEVTLGSGSFLVGSISIIGSIATAGGGTATNSVNVINSAGWIVAVSNTVNNVNIINSAGWVVNIANSAGWVFAQSNTAGGSINIINSAGWIVNSPSTNIINSANWVVFLNNTAGWAVNVINSGRALIAGSAMIGTANVLGTVSSQLLAGVAAVGSVSVLNALSISNLANLTVRPTTSSTTTITAVALSDGLLALLTPNVNRLMASFYNNSTGNLFVKLGLTATTASFTVKMLPFDYYEIPLAYTGSITGIASTSQGNAQITELS